jgi:hypothetical protein
MQVTLIKQLVNYGAPTRATTCVRTHVHHEQLADGVSGSSHRKLFFTSLLQPCHLQLKVLNPALSLNECMSEAQGVWCAGEVVRFP